MKKGSKGVASAKPAMSAVSEGTKFGDGVWNCGAFVRRAGYNDI